MFYRLTSLIVGRWQRIVTRSSVDCNRIHDCPSLLSLPFVALPDFVCSQSRHLAACRKSSGVCLTNVREFFSERLTAQ